MGESWRWQLRDRLGQWMEMDSQVRWLARGAFSYGTIVGSPREGVATVREVGTRRLHDMPTDRLTAYTVPDGEALPTTKPNIPRIPKNFDSLSDRELEDLYNAARSHPAVPVSKWLKIAWEVRKRNIKIYPHSGGFVPAGVFAAGVPTMPTTDAARQMQIRIFEREFNLTTV
jgi:hypothetical protein